MERLGQFLWGKVYVVFAVLLFPVNLGLCAILRSRFTPGTVVHIGELRHLQHHTVQMLKEGGTPATYVGVGDNPHWEACDVHLPHISNPIVALLRDMRVFWSVIARHAVVHCHCMMGISHYQWEFPLLKLMGRRIVAHWRGCEAREREQNMALHPALSICQDCDYAPRYLCQGREHRRRRWVARQLADAMLVTTPDLKDFWPEAEHLPFFLPANRPKRQSRRESDQDHARSFVIVHVTNQPGIEGTSAIRHVIGRLRDKGWRLEFRHVTGVGHDQVLKALAGADLAIGKMKMGYYGNAQVESMALGVPTVTWVRPDLIDPEMEKGGFIVSSLDDLEKILSDLLSRREELSEIGKLARQSIERLHDTGSIVARLRETYGFDPVADISRNR